MKQKVISLFFISILFVMSLPAAVFADVTTLSPYSWDPGLYATASRYNDEVHAWGQRKTGGAWGSGPVNYQSGATTQYRAGSSGILDVNLNGTYCPNGNCQYGSGSGYKGLVQFWNDPSNFIAIGIIHDPGVSPSGNTLMIEGSAQGRPIGGYQSGGSLTGASHRFSFAWDAGGITVTIDHQVTLGKYPVTENNPSVSFLGAARQTGDIADTTFTNISFSSGSVQAQPVTIPAGNPYATFTTTLNQGGSGTGYSAYINSHDANNNAISIGIQTDSGSPASHGQPYYTWERVQNGKFTSDYLAPAASNTPTSITLKWWYGDDTAVFYVGSTPIADIAVHLNPRLFFGVEGNARLNGDTVNDTFTNAQVTVGDTCPTYCGLNGVWNTSSFNFYGINASMTGGTRENANFTVSGTVSGLAPGHDWDSDLVGGIGMIAQYYNGQ